MWVKGRPRASWHLLKARVPGRIITVCERTIGEDARTLDEPPVNEKTCETCFQRRERSADVPT